MLLPSAMSCDGMAQPQPRRPQRPKLYSFERYMPQRSQSPVFGLIASCRALHNIIGEALSPTPTPSLDATTQIQNPFGEFAAKPSRPIASRGVNKRSREESDEDDILMSTTEDQDCCVTPKRRRTVPLELPPGLQASDFEALTVNNTNSQNQPNKSTSMQVDLPAIENRSSHLPELDIPWTDADDRLLVETVLSKLNLSSLEWNDCARKLGKDKDSLGQRWRMLLCEGNVGLRRGTGRSMRPELDIPSW